MLNQTLATLPDGTHVEAHHTNTLSLAGDDDDDDEKSPDASLLKSLIVLSSQSPTREAAIEARLALCALLQVAPAARRSVLYSSLATDCPFPGARALIHGQTAADASTGALSVAAALRVWHAGVAGRLREGLFTAGGGGGLTALRASGAAGAAARAAARAHLESRCLSDSMLAALLRGVLARASARGGAWALPAGAAHDLAVARDGFIFPLVQAASLLELTLLEAAMTPLVELLDGVQINK